MSLQPHVGHCLIIFPHTHIYGPTSSQSGKACVNFNLSQQDRTQKRAWYVRKFLLISTLKISIIKFPDELLVRMMHQLAERELEKSFGKYMSYLLKKRRPEQRCFQIKRHIYDIRVAKNKHKKQAQLVKEKESRVRK